MSYSTAIAARRAFSLPGYRTLSEEGFDGDYVSPIQMTSGNLTGPMLISKDWLDVPSARAHRRELRSVGYLSKITYNKVMDLALDAAGLVRGDVYITPIFHLLVADRSSTIPARDARASFDAVGRHELLGRTPIALGGDSARVLEYFNIAHLTAPHPSARTGSYRAKADQIAQAIKATL